MAILIIVLVITLSYLKIENEVNGVFPEIFGFCLEGIFFVCLFEHYRRLGEERSRVKAKMVLRDSLCHFIKDYVWWATMGIVKDLNKITIDKTGKKFMIPVVDQAKVAIKELENGGAFPTGIFEPIKRYGKKESQMLKCLLPLTSELNSESLKKWYEIIQIFDQLIDSTEQNNLNSFLKSFLEAIVDFVEVDLRTTDTLIVV